MPTINVEAGQVLHVVFDPGMSAELRAIQMMHVAADLRARTYLVSTNYTSELVVRSRATGEYDTRNDLVAIANELAQHSFLAIIPSTVLSPVKGIYEFELGVVSVSNDGPVAIDVTFTNLDPFQRAMLSLLTNLGDGGIPEMPLTRTVRARVADWGLPGETVWELGPSEVPTGRAYVLRNDGDPRCHLIIVPLFANLRKIALQGGRIRV